MSLDKFKALGAVAVEKGADMTQATAGGGDYTPPAEGPCLLRLVGYFEIGKQKGTFKGAPTVKDKVQLVFEVSGPKHPPREAEAGEKIPVRVTVEESLSLNEKARFFKLFRVMNYKGEAQHMVQLVGEAYRGRIIHRKYKMRDGKEGVAVELYDKELGAYTIAPPRSEIVDEATGMPTGEFRVITVPPALTQPKAFLWDHSDLDDWNSLFIEGEFPERKDEKTGKVIAPAKSKNVIQNKIKQAVNFKNSPIFVLISAAGGNLDVPDVDSHDADVEDEGGEAPAPQAAAPVEVPTGAAADDALNGIA